MRLSHFESLSPDCPRCRALGHPQAPLALAKILAREGELIIEGILHCPGEECQLEYPIIDGIPLLVPNVRGYLSDNLYQLLSRQDLSEDLRSLLGDAAGPESAWEITRQHLSSYCWDQYGEFDPLEETSGPKPGSMSRCLEEGLGLILSDAGSKVVGPVIDIGCSVGRSAFDLARRCDGLVLGIDLNFAMLQVAQNVLRTGKVDYARRRVGMVYEHRLFDLAAEHAEKVDFWACDILAPPFASSTFTNSVALNVLDCVSSPRDCLVSISQLMRPGGWSLLTTPYDWSTGATPMEAWIGGHSQRGPDKGASEPLLRMLLTPKAHPLSIEDLSIVSEIENFPWQVRLHERSTVTYAAHIVAARKSAA